MATIVNTNPLRLILTRYGLERTTEAIADGTVTLNLGKIKVGSANGEYYEPTEDQTELYQEIGEFYVVEKKLLEDGLTVSFHALIPESFGNCDIREVGLYEITDEGDKLFAISTQQPIVKPGTDYNYYIAIDYYMFLKSQNLAEIYDQIVLDPDNQFISEDDLREFMASMLFTQGNLSVQIGKNTHIIGLNRPTQLYEQIEYTRNVIGYSSITGNFATFSDFVNSANVLGYWLFDYPGRNMSSFSIADIGSHEYNMSTSSNINLYTRDYYGIVPTLTFQDSEFYYLNPETPFPLYNTNLGEDSSFTMLFTVAPLDTSEDRTLLAKSNYATGAHVFEVNELATGAVEVKLFSDEYNYMTFTSPSNKIKPDEIHSLIISYNKDDMSMSGYINGSYLSFTKAVTGDYTHMSEGETYLYGFTFTPYELAYADSPTEPTRLINRDGTDYEGLEWTIENGEVRYGVAVASYEEAYDTQTPTLFAWTYNDGVSDYKIYTESDDIEQDTVLYNEDYTPYTGLDYIVVPGEDDSYVIQYQNMFTLEYNENEDIPPEPLYAYIVYMPDAHIWANNDVNPTVLFESDGSTYTGTIWHLDDGDIAYGDEGYAHYDSDYNIATSAVGATSFIIDSEGNRVNMVNSAIGVIGVALAGMTNNELRICALELTAMIGKNPCITISE